MRSTFHSVDVLFKLTLFTVLGLSILLGGCKYTYSHSFDVKSSGTELSGSTEFKSSTSLGSTVLRESAEFEWTSPPSSKEYSGPQNEKELMKAFDGDYNSGLLKTEVTAFRKVAGIKIVDYSSKLTLREIDARYPRAEWLQMLLDRGVTINDFHTYSKCLLKRHTLALLEDNPKLRQSGIFNIPPTSDWEAYKEAYINKLVNDHAKIWESVKQIEDGKAEIERAEAEIERSKAEIERVEAEIGHSIEQFEHAIERAEGQIEHSIEQFEHAIERAETQIERSIEQFERSQNEVNAKQLEHVKKEAERAIERSKNEIERAKTQIERSIEQFERSQNEVNAKQLERARKKLEHVLKQIEHLQKTLERPKKPAPLLTD